MKRMSRFLKFIYNRTHKGFYFLCSVFSKGFYFYFYLLASLLRKIFPRANWARKLVRRYGERQENPEYFFFILFTSILLIATIYITFYDSNEVVNLKEMIEEKAEFDETVEEVNEEEIEQE